MHNNYLSNHYDNVNRVLGLEEKGFLIFFLINKMNEGFFKSLYKTRQNWYLLLLGTVTVRGNCPRVRLSHFRKWLAYFLKEKCDIYIN